MDSVKVNGNVNSDETASMDHTSQQHHDVHCKSVIGKDIIKPITEFKPLNGENPEDFSDASSNKINEDVDKELPLKSNVSSPKVNGSNLDDGDSKNGTADQSGGCNEVDLPTEMDIAEIKDTSNDKPCDTVNSVEENVGVKKNDQDGENDEEDGKGINPSDESKIMEKETESDMKANEEEKSDAEPMDVDDNKVESTETGSTESVMDKLTEETSHKDCVRVKCDTEENTKDTLNQENEAGGDEKKDEHLGKLDESNNAVMSKSGDEVSVKEDSSIKIDNDQSSNKEDSSIKIDNDQSSNKEDSSIKIDNDQSSNKEDSNIKIDNDQSSNKEDSSIKIDDDQSSNKEDSSLKIDNDQSSNKEDETIEKPVETSSKDDKKENGNVVEVEKVTDIDGSEFIITINEDDSDNDSDNNKCEDTKKADVHEKDQDDSTKDNKLKETSAIDIANKNVKNESKTDRNVINSTPSITVSASKPPEVISKPKSAMNVQYPTLASNIATGSPSNSMQYFINPATGNAILTDTAAASAKTSVVQIGNSQFQQVLVNGKPVLVPISRAGSTPPFIFSSTQGVAGNKNMNFSLLSQTAPQVKLTHSVNSPNTASQVTKTDSANKDKERDPYLPVGSWEMLDIVKYEVATRKPDNTFWTGLCNVNKKAEISSASKFLLDLGSDIVKESAYKQITHVQTKKKDAGKLTPQEEENLGKMKKVVQELEDKLKHLKMKTNECKGCGFKTESSNAMYFHKEHPHMNPKLNPHGLMVCAHCEFVSKEATEYSYHMEAEHNMTGRVYSKPAFWQCCLCYFENNTKNKLTNHKFKCMKNFKPIQNQAPHHTDVNFCLKNIFYKFMIKKPPPPVVQKALVHDTRNKNPNSMISPNILPKNSTPQQLMAQKQTKVTLYNPPGKSLPNAAVQMRGKAGVPQLAYTSQGQLPGIVYSNQAAALGLATFNKVPVHNQTAVRPKFVQQKQFKQQQPQVTVQQRPHLAVQQRPSQKPTDVKKPTVSDMLKKKSMQRVSTPPAQTAQPSAGNSGGFEVCEICGGYVKDKMSLRVHFFYAHKIDMPQTIFSRPEPPLICDICRKRYWTTQGLSKHKQSSGHLQQGVQKPKTLPVCWICHQKMENLYSHLTRFHRLSTGECMALKRCMFCGIQSNYRKDLEVHMSNAHGVLIRPEQSNVAKSQPIQSNTYNKTNKNTVVVNTSKPVVNTTSKGAGVVRNNFCVFCSVQFPDNTQLTLHCLNTHATCSACGMVVASHSNLKTHVCRAAISRTCRICGMKNLKGTSYLRHMKTHTRKCCVKLKRISNEEITQASKKPKLDKDPENTTESQKSLQVEKCIIDVDMKDDSDRKTADDNKETVGENKIPVDDKTDGDGENKIPVDDKMDDDGENKTTVDDKTDVDGENKTNVDDKTDIDGENKSTVDDKKDVDDKTNGDDENQTPVDNRMDGDGENKTTVDDEKDVDGENKTTVDDKKDVDSENKTAVDDGMDVDSENKTTVDDEKDANNDAKLEIKN